MFKRILIVDRNEDICYTFRMYIEETKGYQVDCTQDVSVAFDLLKTEKYDLIFLDYITALGHDFQEWNKIKNIVLCTSVIHTFKYLFKVRFIIRKPFDLREVDHILNLP